jgi:alkylation response protein AidB-like acyl-CoA dehydrogenase
VAAADDPLTPPEPAATADPVATARAIAEDVLFPDAMEIERSPVVPARYLDLLAGAGLYGLYGPAGCGGSDADPVTAGRVIEALGGASLSTAFVWIQHHSALRAVAASSAEQRDRWLGPLCAGRVRAGIAYAALRRPGPPAMTAERGEGGWHLDGTAPWVTGWGRIEVVLVGARCGEDLVWALVDATASSTLAVEAQELAAMAATATVTMRLDRHAVPDCRVLAVEGVEEWRRRDSLGASVLAVRATAALVAAGGGRSVDLASHAQRLARDAMFLLVFGQTKAIREAQLASLTRLPPPG